MKKRLFSLLLVVAMVISMFPTAALAVEEPTTGDKVAPVVTLYDGEDLSDQSGTYHRNEDCYLEIYIKPQVDSYNASTLTYQWESSTDGKNFTVIDGAPTTSAYTHWDYQVNDDTEITETQITYYRVKITNAGLEDGMTPSSMYTGVAEITMLPEDKPGIVFGAPSVMGNNGYLVADDTIVAEFTDTNYWEFDGLPEKMLDFPEYFYNCLYLKYGNWNTNNFSFVGWQVGNQTITEQQIVDSNKTYVINQDTAGIDEFLGNIDNANWSIHLRISGDVKSLSRAYDIKFDGYQTEIIKDLHITPIFAKIAPMTHQITMVETDNGTVKNIRTGEETHTLEATPDDYYNFGHWEQSTDGSTWSEITDAEATTEVTLTKNTQYRAIFTPWQIETLTIDGYGLPTDGNLFLKGKIQLDTTTNKTTVATMALYEGNVIDERKLLGTTDDLYIYSKKTEAEFIRTWEEKKPSTAQGDVLLVVTLPNGETAKKVYTLVGTLDVTPYNPDAIDTNDVIFFGNGEPEVQLKVTGTPTPETVTWSGGTGALATSNSAVIDTETGLITYSNFYTSQTKTFYADAGDGRLARTDISFKNVRGIKLEENMLTIEEGETESYTAQHSTPNTRVSTNNVTVTSSNESVFTADITTKVFWMYTDIVDTIDITAIGAGTAELTIDVDGKSWTCQVTVPDNNVAVTAVALPTDTMTMAQDSTQQMTTTLTPANVNATQTWSSSAAEIVTVDKNGMLYALSAGVATITVTATDTHGNSVTDTMDVIVTDAKPYETKIYVPKGVVGDEGLLVYPTTGFDADNRDTYSAEAQITLTKDDTDPDYDIYTASLLKGTYSFRGLDTAEVSLGGGSFAIPAESNTIDNSDSESNGTCRIDLRVAEAYITNEYDGAKATAEDFSVVLQNKMGVSTTGTAYTNGEGYAAYKTLLYVNGNALLYYTTATPSATYGEANSVGSRTFKEDALMPGTDSIMVAMELMTTTTLNINAPTGAEVALYEQILNFNAREISWNATSTEGCEAGTTNYIFQVSLNDNMSFRVSMDGKRTQAGFLDKFKTNGVYDKTITVSLTDGAITEQNTTGSAYDESSMLLNLNERNKLELDLGESYKVRGYRASWQIINTITGNIMAEPDYHWNVLSGSDVIDIQTVDGGNAGDNWAWITAKKDGVAIVEVTYDALDNVGGSTGNMDADFFGATDPNRTGVFVVTVGDGYADVPNVDWDAEYNTVYFLEETGTWNLELAGTNSAVSVATVKNGVLGQWADVTATEDIFAVPVASGNNVVKITTNGVTDYRIVRGSQLTVNLDNGVDTREDIYPGDIVTVSLDGIYQPAPKFSGIYNPGFGNTMNVSYAQGNTTVTSPGTQYLLIETAYFDVEIPQDTSVVTLSGGKISGTAMGSTWGNHRQLTDVGVPANFNASSLNLENIDLPDISIAVLNVTLEEAKTDAKAAIESAFATYDETKYTVAYWTLLQSIKTLGLANVDAATNGAAVVTAKTDAIDGMAAVEQIPESGDVGGDTSDPTGVDKTHTESYYNTTGLTFDLADEDADGYVTISFEDYGERLDDADFETPLGVLIEPTEVPYEIGDSIAKVTVRLLNALGIDYANTGEVDNAFYLSALKNFKLSDGTVVDSFGEFDSGAGSGWMITQNSWFINLSTSAFTVEDGDYIKWQNTCQYGKDIGCDWETQSAEILGVEFKSNYGTLSPEFDKDVIDYIYTVPSTVKAIALEAQLESYWSTITCTSGEVSYKPMAEIPVENGTVIVLETAWSAFAGDTPTDTDIVTITIQVKNASVVTTPGTTVVEPEEETSTTVTTEATTDKDGNAKAEISKDTVDTAIEAVEKAATETEGETVKEVKLEVTADKDAKSVETTLPKESVEALNEKVDVVTLETPLGNLTLDADTLATIAKEAKGDVQIIITIAPMNEKADQATVDMVGDKPVVDCKILSNGEAISHFNGTIKVSIPYTPEAGENTKKLTVLYIDDDGKAVEMKDAAYNGKNAMEFDTTYFSTFAVAYDESKIVFDDVTTADWFYDAISYVVNAGLFNGISDDEFAPNSNMTRAMIWTVLARASDVDTSTSDPWYQIGMDWAMETGVSDGTNPNGNVTREQLATMLYRYSNDTAVTADLSGYTDLANVSDWALEAMNWAVSKGIVTGKTTTTLVPGSNATRAEVATMMMRYLEG